MDHDWRITGLIGKNINYLDKRSFKNVCLTRTNLSNWRRKGTHVANLEKKSERNCDIKSVGSVVVPARPSTSRWQKPSNPIWMGGGGGGG